LNPISDVEFIQFAAQSGRFEIESSNIALMKATTSDVRLFAGEMVTEHTVQDQELKSLAATKNIALPTSLPAEKQAIIMQLNNQTGSTFEKTYMNAQVTSHDETIQMFERAAESAKDADIKAFANKYLPALREHREHASDVKGITDAL
jgi:putative membrane protein